MKAFLLNLLLASFLPSISVYGQQGFGPCTAEQDKFCADQANRICALKSDGSPECTDCVANSVVFKAGCIPLDEIELFAYLEEFQVDYRTSVSREERWALLLKSLAFISEYQAKNPNRTYELGLTPASADGVEDMKHRTGLNPALFSVATAASDKFQQFSFNASDPVPTKVNWIDAGAVTDVKDQGRCGCSWAIAAAGAIEGAAVAAGTALQSLSWQQLISCDTATNLGCEGGDITAAFAFAVDYGGLETLASYPYTDEQGVTTTRCYASKQDISVQVSSGSLVLEYSSLLSLEKRQEKMKQAVSIQPVAIGISSGCPTFANYKSGILTSDGDCFCATSDCVDHGVLLVGYNDEAPIPYWIIKNSWSTEWGEGGYARIAQYDTGSLYGLFGIMTHGVTANVNVLSNPQVVPPKPAEEEPLFEWWHILLIIIGSILVLCCLFWTCANCIAPEPHHEKA